MLDKTLDISAVSFHKMIQSAKDVYKRQVFYVSGSYLHFRNFEIIKTQVTIREHTQSECIYNQGGNHNIYENLDVYKRQV